MAVASRALLLQKKGAVAKGINSCRRACRKNVFEKVCTHDHTCSETSACSGGEGGEWIFWCRGVTQQSDECLA
jgi:hypothetical protein